MLDKEVREKFKEFQRKSGKYSALLIDDVRFEKKAFFVIVSLTNGSEFPTGYVKRTEVIGDIPLISAGTKNDIMGHIKSLIGNKKDEPTKHYVYNNTKNIWNEVKHYSGKDYYTLTADGVYGGTLILRKKYDYPKGFYTTNVCKVLDFKDKNIYESYFLNAYRIEKEKYKFGFALKANNDNLKQILVPIPKDLNQTYTSFKIQEAIVEFLEYSFKREERIKKTIDKRYALFKRLDKALIPSTFIKDYVKVAFGRYAKEHNINFNIMDVKFEIKRIHSDNKDELVCKKRMGFSPKSSNTDDINWFRVEDLNATNGLFIDSPNTVKKTTIANVISKDGKKSSKNVSIQKGDILVSFLATPGIVKIYNSDKVAYCNQAIDILNVSDDMNNRYIAYNCMIEYPKYGKLETMGLNLNDEDKKKIKIFIPKDLENYTSLEIQEIIANFIEEKQNYIQKEFDKMDEGYEALERLHRAYLARTFTLIDWGEK